MSIVGRVYNKISNLVAKVTVHNVQDGKKYAASRDLKHSIDAEHRGVKLSAVIENGTRYTGVTTAERDAMFYQGVVPVQDGLKYNTTTLLTPGVKALVEEELGRIPTKIDNVAQCPVIENGTRYSASLATTDAEHRDAQFYRAQPIENGTKYLGTTDLIDNTPVKK